MAVFFDTGGGDIYGGESREEVIAAMREDGVFDDYDESGVSEVPGTHKVQVLDEDEKPTGELITLEDEFVGGDGAYLVATSNS